MITRKERAKETNSRILDEAYTLFISQGYLNTTIDQIAEAASVGKGSIFRHFESKMKLALTIIKIQSEEYIEEIEKSLKNGDTLANVMKILYFQTGKKMDSCLNITQLLFSLYLDKLSIIDRKEFISTARFTLEPIYKQLASVFEKYGVTQPLLHSRLFFAILDGLSLQIALEGKENDEKMMKDLYLLIIKMFNLEIGV